MKKIIVLCGPTAVGKSKVALAIAKKFDGEIVSADSQQVWEGLDIGTAKPSIAIRREIPHHLIDCVRPDEHFDVSRYCQLADKEIDAIIQRDHLPIVVGGTGMYLRCLVYGLCEAPPQDKVSRKKLMERAKKEGLPVLYEELKRVDSETSKKLHPNDITRIIRALEVYGITGKPLSHFQKKHSFQEKRYGALQLGLHCDRKVLHQNIERRVDWMMANGWVEEVRELLKFYSSNCQALQSIGYKQIVQHLKGLVSLEDTIHSIKKQTKAYARRQLTWFRGDKNIQWLDSLNGENFLEAISSFLQV